MMKNAVSRSWKTNPVIATVRARRSGLFWVISLESQMWSQIGDFRGWQSRLRLAKKADRWTAERRTLQ
jgi:hypothetical protein